MRTPAEIVKELKASGLDADQMALVAMLIAAVAVEAAGQRSFVRQKPAEDGVRVYVMEDAAGRVKVGISQNPYWRRKQLAYELKTEITLYYATAGMTRAEALAIEARAHSDLAEHRVVGEWFSCDLGDAVDVVQQAKAFIQ
jgi:hypothetical protein